ncbi:MAG: type II toxin-antitoxin system YafQ family toxin [Candidatus Paceibacterota bacterium]
MYSIHYGKKYERAIKKLAKSGSFNLSKLEKVINTLACGKSLDKKHGDHSLSGELKNFRECHIESDLLLVYQIDKKALFLILIDLGSHSDLFG